MIGAQQPGAPGQNTGHGHVYPRPDGARARCGGAAICRSCAADAARKVDDDRRERPPTVAPLHALGGACDWGGCHDETTALRWSPELEQWVSVCARHETEG